MSDDQPLQSKLFFLDTQTYMARNFQFDYGVLQSLRDHLDEDDCHLLITDVNVREIRRHLRRKAVEAVGVINRAKKDAMILRNTPELAWHGIFTIVTIEQVQFELDRKFDDFLNSPHVEVVKTNAVNIDKVFDAYFEEKPPFATSGKKSEFPDAFVLLAIEAISKQRGHRLYVVSEDRDVKSFCGLHENLISLGRLEELLQLILKNSERLAEPAKFAEAMYERFEAEIQRTAQEQLDSTEFELEAAEEYSEAEIDAFTVEKIEYLAKNLTEVSEQGAVFELVSRLSVIVEISFPDYDRSPWDPEDKAYPFVFHNKLVRRYIQTASIYVGIGFDDGIAANAELVWVDTDNLIDISAAKVEQISYREMDFSDEDETGH